MATHHDPPRPNPGGHPGGEAARLHLGPCDADLVPRCAYVTGDDTLKSWHRARMTPPPTHELRVAFEERLAAREHGARWDAVLKSWVVRTRAPLDEWVRARVKAKSGISVQ